MCLKNIVREDSEMSAEARFFLLVDLKELLFRFRVGGRNKINIFFFNISRKNSKTGKANQLSVLNF